MPEPITIVGGGPAGAAAALAAGRQGARAAVWEESAFPRHKVCGEFYSPEILPRLESLGVAADFLQRRPARVTHAELHFAKRHRRFPLPEPAFGLSRYAFDLLLLRAARSAGAEVRRARAAAGSQPLIWAAGRAGIAPRGSRLFGFKAHFAGHANDAVELFFFPGGYCGLCAIEDGRTNVCGLAAESLLRRCGFQLDRLVSQPSLATRLRSLERVTRWLVTGPLQFGASAPGRPRALHAGDAGRFVDPFTGSGLLAALQTGAWAGDAAVDALDGKEWLRCLEQHERQCASFYGAQTMMTSVIRKLLGLGWAEHLAGLLPGSWLFRLTRPLTHNFRPQHNRS